MTQNPKLAELSEAGVSVWLDDLSREMIASGALQDEIDGHSVVGVTTNPAIFQASIAKSDVYDEQIATLAGTGADVDATLTAITTDDVRSACDVFEQVFADSDGVDGRVSIEVDPRLAHDTDGTVAQAIELHRLVDRPNVLIKIPATKAGLPAITRTLAAGVSVNVTLIFSVERYGEVIDAFLDGLDAALENGHDIAQLVSVASFFVSRVDTEVDNRLEAIGTPEALALRGKAGLANARLAYAAYQEVFDLGVRFPALKSHGARPQRPLWASTGVKNPDYPDTLYVSELVAPDTVNTIPGKTLEAFADHGWVNTESIIGRAEESREVFEALTRIGVNLPEVFEVLESEGVAKFEVAWNELLTTTAEQLESAQG
ncbi:transaldolase [Gordonia hirsuta DSM 44140 = NBRC 16056]|uniref:Transaldolase n=1 Tax=Gordonia hirsuta DSM 44140 = NBRC 16056 TaxID=1121927 RepID=L7LB48_9ACTN|nr:transaldolase [Gordonia hirsuta]GAC57292.1 transaldolase [Gordonia hirsuta DSM 44140 = NBRC 16056]